MLQVPESQVVEWVKQMSPDAKQAIIKALLPELDRLDVLVDYGEARMREICRQRGLEWNSLSEAEREAIVDTWLHEPQSHS